MANLLSGKVYIIAEAGVNHNGDISKAIKLVDKAAEAGADAVKFQTFTAEKLASSTIEKAEYQKKNTGLAESQFEMLKKLELSHAEHEQIQQYCCKKDIQFLSTPFDLDSLNFLVNSIKVPVIKISSGDLTNGPLLLKSAQTNLPIILSTGMGKLGEIEEALSVLAYGYSNLPSEPSKEAFETAYASSQGQLNLRRNVSLLHCTTQYPTSYENVNLRAVDTLRKSFGLRLGYSDHTLGIEVSIAAVALGAQIIEKHFTLDKNLPGPDHKASLDPNELKEMVLAIRNVEQAMGHGQKVVQTDEMPTRKVARKCLVAARPIKKGQLISKNDILILRAGGQVSPMLYWTFLNRKASRAYSAGEPLEL